MIQLTNILVPTDFGTTSEAALVYARDFAGRYHARLHLLHVADNVLARFAGSVAFQPDLQTEVETAAKERVDAVLTERDRSELHALGVVITSLTVADAIVDFAKDRGMDLIVMGTHGRGAVAHLLMGSVAERVVRLAPCPVLTVRRPEPEVFAAEALGVVAAI